MLYPQPDRESACALVLIWLVAPIIAIGIGTLAGLLALVGSLAALCSSIIRMLRAPRLPVSRVQGQPIFVPFFRTPRRPLARQLSQVDRALR